MSLLHRSCPLLLLLLATAGCVVGPEPQTPTDAELGVPAGFHTVAPSTGDPATELGRWWQLFDDPVLVRLVDEALLANTDVDAAGARVRQARAALRIARAGWWPTLGAGATATRRFRDETGTVLADGTVYDAGFDAAYEVDLFGGQRRTDQAARAGLESVQADLHTVQLAVAAEVALNYVDARLAQRQLSIAHANLAAQDETLQIVGWRLQAGLVGSLDLEQARQLRAQTAAAVPLLEQAYAAATHRLAVLAGTAPGALNPLLADEKSIPLAPAPTIAIPADVLRRRPDVTSAERTLAAETARIGIREADLYPALRLAGSFGGTSGSWSDVFDASVGSVVAGITAPIFEGGRLRAAVEQQRAAAAAAFANYRGTVLLALEDTENALVAVSVTERRERELVIAEEAAGNAALLARSQYQAGLIDFQTLLDAERSLLVSQESRANARAGRAAALVQLYKALGGGWEAAPLPQSLQDTSS
jgi:NodT family efflux transporter outer membrane factor (OMF) lipoprotein